jgi:signal transduction histidine kinase
VRGGRCGRNPLHGICGALELCRSTTVAPGDIGELLHDMQEGVDLMCAITNDLLDLEKLRSGKFVVKPTPVPLRALVDNVSDAARPACTGALNVVIDPAVPPTLLVDGLRLRQVRTHMASQPCKNLVLI